MATTHLEVERAFSVPPGSAVPPLSGLPGVRRAEPAGTVRLDATYYDTGTGALLDAGVTLRRRTGGGDAGWHLKLPVSQDGAREEVQVALGEEQPDPVPGELLHLVAGWTRGAEVAPAARIRTRRSTTRLIGEDGQVLAELADDLVEGQAAGPGVQPTYWREWELELVTGDRSLLDDAETLFARHDVLRSAVQRKVAVVLGEPTRTTLPPAKPKKPAHRAVHARIAKQVQVLRLLDPVTRQGRPEGVHGMRKASRRLRSVLAAYRALLDREQTDPLREELRWLAGTMGESRDATVVLDRLETMLDDEPYDVTAAREQLAARRGPDAGVEALDSERYFALREALDALVVDPPWTDLAHRPAREVLPELLSREGKRLRKVGRHSQDPHDVRKAAKRLRYAYEVVEPLWPEAREPRRAAKELTEVLGDRQDGVVAREVLQELAAEATGPAGFTWGRLHALEEAREVELEAAASRAWRRVRRLSW